MPCCEVRGTRLSSRERAMLRVIAATSGGTWETLAATYRRRTGRQLADGAAVATLKRLDDRKLVARAWRGRRLHYLPLT